MLYLSEMCQQGKHDLCDGGTPAPPGVFGGTQCTCSCHARDRDIARTERIRQIKEKAWQYIW